MHIERKPTKGEVTQARILRAAIREFGTHGLYGATIDGVGRRAKTRKPLILHYFKNKYGLLDAAVREVQADFARILSERKTPIRTDMDAVDDLFESNLHLAKEHEDSVRLMLMLYANSSYDKRLKKLHETVLNAVRTRYEALLREGVARKSWPSSIDVESVARVLHQWIVGSMYEFIVTESAVEAEKRLRRDWRILSRSLLGSKSGPESA